MKAIYPSLEQRMIDTCLETFPSFMPESGIRVSEQAQWQFYDFIREIFLKMSKEPALMFTKQNPDDHFTYRFNRAYDKKPKLYTQMQAAVEKIEMLLKVLFEIGKSGQIDGDTLKVGGPVKIGKNQLAVLGQCGVKHIKENGQDVFVCAGRGELPVAWKWMATRADASVLRFSRCMFSQTHSYASDVYASLLGDETAFHTLESYLTEKGYTRIDNRDDQIALDYVKNYDKKEMPVKDSWAERTHGGISLKYYNYVDKPACISLRVPKLKEILAHFDAMEPELKEFVAQSSKKCDGCRYCVQTDKTGKRNLIFVDVVFDEQIKLCPLFPGFYYCWSFLDEKLAGNMVRYLSFIDTMLAK